MYVPDQLCLITASKMFVSGDDSYRSSLALDFTTNEGCSILPKFWPVDSFSLGVGGMLDNVPIFCDSAKWKFQDDQKYKDLWDGCMLWKSGKWRRGPNMLTNRIIPAGIIMGNKVWITGGSTCTEYSYSNLAPTDKSDFELRTRKNCYTSLKTELITLESTKPFVDLPKHLMRHCIIKINDDLVLVTGGHKSRDEDPTRHENHYEKNTHFFSFSNQRWIPGPDMLLERASHACGTFLMGDETIMVVAGGSMIVEEEKLNGTDSVELLSLQNLDKGWFKGIRLKRVLIDTISWFQF